MQSQGSRNWESKCFLFRQRGRQGWASQQWTRDRWGRFCLGEVCLTPLKFTSCRTVNESRILCTNPCTLAKSPPQTIPWNMHSLIMNFVPHSRRQIHLPALLGCRSTFFKGLSHGKGLGKNIKNYECYNLWTNSNRSAFHIYNFGQRSNYTCFLFVILTIFNLT